jgi:uncharacterized membrane protein
MTGAVPVAIASSTASVISLAVIVFFAARGLDPVLNLFYWFSGLAVVAIVVVEALVASPDAHPAPRARRHTEAGSGDTEVACRSCSDSRRR